MRLNFHKTEFIHHIQYPRSPLHGFVDVKVQVRGVFDPNTLGHLALHQNAVLLEEFDDAVLLGFGPEGGYKYMRLFKVGCDIHRTDCDQKGAEIDIPKEEGAQFTFNDFAHSSEAVFHTE